MEPYVLGVDLGTTYTAAAIGRGGRAEICQLGTATSSIPSIVVVSENGDIAIGETAERRASAEPTRVGREFKRRLGDTTPLMLGGTPYTPEALMAIVLKWVVAQVSQTEGGPPSQVVLTHPANFGPYKLDLMREVGRLADLDNVVLLSEPQAAAVSYAQRSAIDQGAVVVVYDFGGGTFDAALVRRTADSGFELIGSPTGMDRLGGIDVDQAVLGHVLEHLSVDLDPSDPAVLAATWRLRDDCRRAKEALSTDTSAEVAVHLPTVNTSVVINRSELENLIRPRVIETVEATQRAVRLAGLELATIDRILLVGGTSRMPMVADLLRSTLHRPVAVDANPKNAICLGAALIASQPAPLAVTAPLAPPAPPVGATAATVAATPVAPTGLSAPITAPPFVAAASPAPKKRTGLIVGGVAAAIALTVAAVVLLAGGDDNTATAPTDPPATEPVATNPPDTATAAASTTTPAPAAAFVVSEPWDEADGRTASFGPFDYEITGVELSNSEPPFDDTATVAGPTTVRMTFDLINRIDKQGTDLDNSYVLQLANGDQFEASFFAPQFLDGGTSGDQELDFVLDADVVLDDSTLAGAVLLFNSSSADRVRAGIPLSGTFEAADEPDKVVIESAAIEFDTVNQRHSWVVVDAAVSFDDRLASGSGTFRAVDTRAVPGGVWVIVSLRFTCISAPGGCLDSSASIRLAADGTATDTRYPVGVISAGTSDDSLMAFQVDSDATAYTLLISPSGDLSAPTVVALPINAAIVELLEPQQQFQRS